MPHAANPLNAQNICVGKSEAAAMLSLSPNRFSELVKSGAMPKPREVGTRRLWIVSELHSCAAALPSQEENDTWGDL